MEFLELRLLVDPALVLLASPALQGQPWFLVAAALLFPSFLTSI